MITSRLLGRSAFDRNRSTQYDCNNRNKSKFERRKNMVVDFMEAALPWILLGLFVAISCSFISKTKKYIPINWEEQHIIIEPDAQMMKPL